MLNTNNTIRIVLAIQVLARAAAVPGKANAPHIPMIVISITHMIAISQNIFAFSKSSRLIASTLPIPRINKHAPSCR